jgi:hypothetical protein
VLRGTAVLLRFRDPYARYGYEDTRDEHVERLKNELDAALSTIVHLMPEEMREVLQSYYLCESPKDAEIWEPTARWKIIELAKPMPDEELSYGYNLNKRAPCPLCVAESSSPYQRGFSLPEGLHRHLEGYGNVRECGVMAAARRLSKAYFFRRFAEAEKKELQEHLLSVQIERKPSCFI